MPTFERPAYTEEGSTIPDGLLFAGPYVTQSIAITAGPYLRGQLVTAAGAAIGASGTDGFGVLAEDCNGTGTPVTATVYTAGVFNQNKLNFGGSTYAATVADLRAKGIHIRAAQGA